MTVGTHEDPFDRLVRAAEILAATERVVLQRGTSTVPTPNCEDRAFLDPAELSRAMAEARVVIGHAGPSTLFEAASHGHVPIVVPRSPAHGEHVDDHQLRFARRIADRVHVVTDPAHLPGEVERHFEMIGDLLTFRPDEARAVAFADGLERICESAVQGNPRRGGLHDRLRALRTWMNLPT